MPISVMKWVLPRRHALHGEAQLFPVAGEVRISHQPGSVMARTFHMVDLDQYVQGTNVGTGAPAFDT